MDSGDLQYREIFGIGQAAHKKYSAPVNLTLHFSTIALPVGLPFWQTPAIADFITSNNDHLSSRPKCLQLRQATHKGMEATVRFKVASDVSHDFIPGMQALPIKLDPSPRIRLDSLGIDTFVDDSNLFSQFPWVT